MNSDTQDINIKYMNKIIQTSAISSNGLDDLKKHIITLIDKDYLDINLLIPLNSTTINSWLYKNCYVYDNNLCQINSDSNKIKVKISSINLDIFKSKFPDIHFNYM